MKRGDVYAVSLSGVAGKPRPALVVQADGFDAIGTVMFCPLTSKVLATALFRPVIEPDQTNGLREVSRAMTDKLPAARRQEIGGRIGAPSKPDMAQVDRAIVTVLGLDLSAFPIETLD